MREDLNHSAVNWSDFDYEKTKVKHGMRYGKSAYAHFIVCSIPYNRRTSPQSLYRLIYQHSSAATWHRERTTFETSTEARYMAELHNNALYVLEMNKALSQIAGRLKKLEYRDEVLINAVKKFALLTNRELSDVLGDDYYRYT